MRTFKVKENGKTYIVAVRAYYQNSITSEKKLREVVKTTMTKRYGEASASKSLFEACSILGVLTYSAPERK